MVIRPDLFLIHLENVAIYEQLEMEEMLLRGSDENFCIINQGSSRAIVMGVSGEPQKLLDVQRVKQEQIPVIRRFSGGGTVIVDESTLFITFIFSKNALEISPFPEPILRWSEKIYKECWGIHDFQLVENDFCIGDKKCGGNAQYIRKDRWLHHTSFLWDYSPENMKYLLLPDKRPKYRLDRSHDDFLIRLKNFATNSKELVDKLIEKASQFANVKTLCKAKLNQNGLIRKSLEMIDLESYPFL